MNRRFRILCTVALCLALTGMTASFAGAAPAGWAIATSSSGSSPYKQGSNLANVVSRHQSRAAVSAQASAGFNENLFLVAAGEVKIGMIASLDLMSAYNGLDRYKGNPQFKNLRRMFPYSIEHGHQFVRADSDIHNFTDIKGKRFNMNVPATITSIRNDNMLAAFGMSRKDVKVVEIATSGSFDAIRDNVADMSANGLSIGNASLLELSSSIPIRLIEIPKDVFPKFNDLMGGAMAYGFIPGGTYKGQDKDVWTFVSYNLLFTHKDADEETIYGITKAFWENLKELGEMDSGFKLLKSEDAVFGPKDVPLHPGAERYLKEAGLLK